MTEETKKRRNRRSKDEIALIRDGIEKSYVINEIEYDVKINGLIYDRQSVMIQLRLVKSDSE